VSEEPNPQQPVEGAPAEPAEPRRRRGRWIGAGIVAAAVVVAVFVVVLSGGGGGGLNAIAKAAEVTQQESGGHATFTSKTTVAGSPEGFLETGNIAFDQGGKVGGTVVVKGLSTGKELTTQLVGEGRKVYMSSEAFDSISEGKKWVELNLTAAAKAEGGSADASNSPQEGLKLLEQVADAKQVGEEEVDGVPTTHWSGTLPTPDEVFGVKVHYSVLHLDAWIDAKDRVRRVRIDVNGSIKEGEPQVNIGMTINYVSFGQVPAITMPSADEVFDATSLIESNVQEAAGGN
jgi:hypothetical protein